MKISPSMNLSSAKAALSEIVRSVRRTGKSVVITVDGEPAARIDPVQADPRRLTAAESATVRPTFLRRRARRVLARAGHAGARTARLRAYDAVYVALALKRDAALLTLDSEVRSKTAEAFPDLSLVAPTE